MSESMQEAVVVALIVESVILICGALLTTVGGAYWKDRRKFAGRWVIEITWTPEHAVKLFGKEVIEPYSHGSASISYGLGRNQKRYWGLSYFRVFAGAEDMGFKEMAHLCVEFVDMIVRRHFFSRRFPFILVSELESIRLRSCIREKKLEKEWFTYGSWRRYQLRFDQSTGQVLVGRIVLEETDESVGTVRAQRTDAPA